MARVDMLRNLENRENSNEAFCDYIRTSIPVLQSLVKLKSIGLIASMRRAMLRIIKIHPTTPQPNKHLLEMSLLILNALSYDVGEPADYLSIFYVLENLKLYVKVGLIKFMLGYFKDSFRKQKYRFTCILHLLC
jgi:hypothetical protein